MKSPIVGLGAAQATANPAAWTRFNVAFTAQTLIGPFLQPSHALWQGMIFVAIMFCAGCAPMEPIVVPLTMRERSVLVPVSVRGKEFQVVLDSGDSGSIALTDSALQWARARPFAGNSKGMDVMGNMLESPRFQIPEIQLGNVTFSNIIADRDVHAPTYPANQIGQVGFLGTALLDAYRVVLDYRHRKMTLIAPDDRADRRGACDGTSTPFAPEWKGQPVTIVDSDLGQLRLWWDTGMPVSVLSRAVVARLTKTSKKSSAQELVSTRLKIGETDFGPWTFSVWDMALPPGFDGFIGHDFFERHLVCMDFPERTMRIQRTGSVSSAK